MYRLLEGLLLVSPDGLAEVSPDHVQLITDKEALRPKVWQLWRAACPRQAGIAIPERPRGSTRIRESRAAVALAKTVAAGSEGDSSEVLEQWRAAAVARIRLQDAASTGPRAGRRKRSGVADHSHEFRRFAETGGETQHMEK